MDENVNQQQTEIPPQQPPPFTPPQSSFNLRLLAIIFVGILVIILIGTGGYLLWVGQNQSITTVPQTTPTQTAPTESSLSPTPTPDLTANWKTYTNHLFNFTLKYPPDWTVTDLPPPPVWDEATVTHVRSPGTKLDHGLLEGASLDITVTRRRSQSLVQFVSERKKYYKLSSTSTYQINGIQGILLSVPNDPESGQTWQVNYFMFERGDVFITITSGANGLDANKNPTILDQILSTFTSTQ